MDQRTLTALQGSIAKWEAIVNGTGVDQGTANCPLCAEFLMCAGCPVKKRTRLGACRHTPYDAWRNYFGDDSPINHGAEPGNAHLAQAELDFLRSLLPRAER